MKRELKYNISKTMYFPTFPLIKSGVFYYFQLVRTVCTETFATPVYNTYVYICLYVNMDTHIYVHIMNKNTKKLVVNFRIRHHCYLKS